MYGSTQLKNVQAKVTRYLPVTTKGIVFKRMETLPVFVSNIETGSELACGTLARSKSGYFRFSYDPGFINGSRNFTLSPHDLNTAVTALWREHLPYVLLDAEVGAWGQKVLIHAEALPSDLVLKFFPVHERIGAITFGLPEERAATSTLHSDLETCLTLTQRVDICPQAADAQALVSLTAGIGGSRPKAMVELNPGELAIAKFPAPNDAWPVVNSEFLGMRLAQLAGLRTAEVRLVDVNGLDVLLVDRFDVTANHSMRQKRHMFSALTALRLLDWEARYASYPDFADFLFMYSHAPKDDCRELYARMVLNMMIGNTDDHARNHAVFWDGAGCRLTPAYDIVVFPRAGTISSQAMIVGKKGSIANKHNSLSECHRFGLTTQEARDIHDRIAETVSAHWKQIADEARLPGRYQEKLKGRAILPFESFFL